MLLCGSRPEALKCVRIEDLNLRERVMHIRAPKGGTAKAFDIPLSRAMMESIFRLRRIGPVIYPQSGCVWLFPSDSPSGHMEEHKEKRTVLSHWGNDLRQTYRTLGQAAEISEVDMHLLMNHALPGGAPPGCARRERRFRLRSGSSVCRPSARSASTTDRRSSVRSV